MSCKNFMVFLFLICWNTLKAQDLNCKVDIISPQIQTPQKVRVFATLQGVMANFMNKRKWSADLIKPQERIVCNLILNITNWDGSSTYSGAMTIQSSRPVYGASYTTNVLNMSDRYWNFTYTEGQPLDFADNGSNSELSNLLAFYAYMIVGMDYDTFSLQGGSPYFLKAQSIINQSQGSQNKGWRAFDDLRNRYWLIENMLNPDLSSFREAIYVYHRKGLDVLASNPDKARGEIAGSLPQIKNAQTAKPNSMLSQLFFLSKADEIIKIFAQSNDPRERSEIATQLSDIDPSNSGKYQLLMR